MKLAHVNETMQAECWHTVMLLASSGRQPVISSLACTGFALRVEERGLSVSWSALRVSYAMGGDGESNIRADMRHLAAFVRDPITVVSCILLPFSCSMHLEMQVSHHQLQVFSKGSGLPSSVANIAVRSR